MTHGLKFVTMEVGDLVRSGAFNDCLRSVALCVALCPPSCLCNSCLSASCLHINQEHLNCSYTFAWGSEGEGGDVAEW